MGSPAAHSPASEWPGAKVNVRVILGLTLIHFTGDFYNAMVAPLFPLFVAKMGLSLAQVGIIAGVMRLLAFIVQPTVGYFADRYQTRWFILGGVLLPIVFIPLSGIAPNYWLLLASVAVGSLGSSMFHPSVTGMVPLYAGRKAGLSMSMFNTGGTLGFALGPLFITWYATRFGLEAVPATMLIGLAFFVYFLVALPAPQSEGLQAHGFANALRESLGPVWKSIVLIWVVMVLRAMVSQSFMTFIPVFFVQKGYSLVSTGSMLALFTLAGTLSGIAAGYWSDRIGYRTIFLIAHGLMTPVFVGFLYLPSGFAHLGATVCGAFALATLPLGVVMAQALAPKGRSMVSSLMMGLAYGMGGMLVPVVGKAADLFGIHDALLTVSFIPLITIGLILRFPDVPAAR